MRLGRGAPGGPTLRPVVVIVIAAMLAATLITVAFGEGDSPRPGVLVEWLDGDDEPTAVPSPTLPPIVSHPATPTPLPPAEDGEVAAVTGFTYPVAGACLPSSDDLLPGALREYRSGVHEGVDFYDSDNCAPSGIDTEILAAKAGTVIRADLAHVDLTAEEFAAFDARIQTGEANDPGILDAYRGRQVWVDHGDGTVTRYCHLHSIAEGITVGTQVAQGELIAFMGESGAPESITAPGTQVHLHFEIRVGEGYLGQGLPADQVRVLYEEAFAP